MPRWALLLMWAAWAGHLSAERLPIRTYYPADGLPAAKVRCLAHDSHGFLWLCTEDGLVRYDGYTFVAFGLKEGIPNRSVTAFLETHDAAYWIGTYHGVAHFRPEFAGAKPGPFVRYGIPGPADSQFVTALAEDRSGALWCGTHNGVFRKPKDGGFAPVDLGLHGAPWTRRYIQALAVDSAGGLWVGTEGAGLYRRSPDGRIEHYPRPCTSVSSLLADAQGRVWAGSYQGICLLSSQADGSFACTHRYTERDGLPNTRIHALLAGPHGEIWAGTEGGIGVLAPGTSRFVAIGAANGLSDPDVRALGADSDSNVWAAATSYLMCIARRGFATYTTADGLATNHVTSIFEDRHGSLLVANGYRDFALNRLEGGQFHAVHPLLLRKGKPIHYTGWSIGQNVLEDSHGDWWIATGEGLCRFTGIHRLADLAAIPPVAVYTTADGLPGNDIFRVFEDSHGDIWVGTADTPGLARWQRQTGRFERVGAADGFITSNWPAAFAEDRDGDLWAGLFWKGLARRRNGRWKMFLTGEEAPNGSRWALLVDHRGRLWIGSSASGVSRIDNPAAENPTFTPYTTQQGLSSDLIWSLAENRHGQIYVANQRGVDVLDPDSGVVLSFNSNDGLAGGDPVAAWCDRQGAVWLGTTLGLSRLVTGPEPPRTPPPVRITALRAGGEAQPLSALGAAHLSALELLPGRNRLDIEFASFNFQAGNSIRYQYRLGSGRSWEDLGQARVLHLDALAPGRYRFEVRALEPGAAGGAPAAISFRVLPPVWRRWWSLTLMAGALAGLLYAAYRFRVAQLLEMEKVRMRIAMDLHDDIGASLSQIAILSEVARRQTGGRDSAVNQPLSRVADISRELSSSLGDIVWAINPQRDRLGDLAQRMRRFGSELLNAHHIEFECIAPDDLLDTEIGAGIRRQVLLVFKESMHNIARHSGCLRARAELSIQARQLTLQVSDDGTGFDIQAHPENGNGLASMRQRAEQAGGTLQVNSRPGQGTQLCMQMPLRRRYLFR